MNTVFPLSTDRYAGRFWKRADNWLFIAHRPLIPVVLAELDRAFGAMPLAFVLHRGRFQLVAVLGTDMNRSLAVDHQGRWRPGHCPLMVSTYPFVLVDGRAGGQMVSVDERTHLVNPDSGEPFFDDTGTSAPRVEQIVAQLKRTAVSRLATRKATDILAEADLFEPLVMNVAGTRLHGLYRLNEKKLRTLPSETLKSFLGCGAFTLTYAHLFSLSRFSLLEQWAKDDKIHGDTVTAGNLKFLFDEKDDLFRF